MRSCVSTLLTMGWLLLLPASSGSVAAQEVTAPQILGYERAHREAAPSASAGRVLMSELSCRACHVSDADATAPKSGPVLTGLGNRLRMEHVREFLTAPQQVRPGTTMPDPLSGLNAAERSEVVESLVAYLGVNGSLRDTAVNAAAVERGKEAFVRNGCGLCHAERDAATGPGISLDALASRTSIPALTAFLKEPLSVRPSGRMPHFGLPDNEASDIASYLLREIEVPARLSFRYYEGNWDKLPDYAALKPVSEGQATSLDVGVGARRDNFGLVFETFLVVPRDGRYTFHLGSDDGSRLILGDEVLITVDGIHPVVYGSESRELQAGAYPIRIEYFEGGGGEELYLEWEGPELGRQSVEGWLSPDGTLPQEQMPMGSDAGLVERGREAFVSYGCAACHKMDGVPTPDPQAPRLSEALSGGCLDGEGRGPRYVLDDHQRQSLESAIRAGQEPTAQERVAETLVRFNCIACHRRGDFSGPEPRHDAIFTSTQPEMGDEGRLPPPLDGVGAKLRPEWLGELLDRGARDRFYMGVRMPGFGRANVGHLVEDLAAIDPLGDVPPVVTDEPARRLKVVGRQLVGDQGLSCIKCHVFGDSKATGIQAISLTTMHRRLREDWFRVYMLDPNALRPGTRMPQSWPEGQTFFKKLLGGDTVAQIHSVWVYLEDGGNAPIPSGIGSVGIELVPDKEPLIYRNFIQDAGARAIGVGYPERVHLAFDAEQLRLAIIWQGAFIDAGLHWSGRGVGYQRPLGDNVLKFASGAGATSLADPMAPWPNTSARELGGRFIGYRLDEARRPVFRYSLQGSSVEDQFNPIPETPFAALERVIEVSKVGDQALVWRVAESAVIAEESDGSFVTSEGLRIEPKEGTKLSIVEQGGRAELRWIAPSGTDFLQGSWTYRW